MTWTKESERHVLASKGIKTKETKQAKQLANNIDCPKCHKDNCFVNTEGKVVFVECHNCGYKDSQELEDDVFTCHGNRTYKFNELSPSAKKRARKYPRNSNTRYGQGGEEVY